MKKVLLALAALALVAVPSAILAQEEKIADRLQDCGDSLSELMNVPDGIPEQLIDKAECVIVIPSTVKGAFIVGGSYGRGAMSCRSAPNYQGPWGPPSMMALEGGSLGFQIGGQATDYVILVMNVRGVSSLLDSKVKIGADVSAAAGPVGRDAGAATDTTLRSELLTYSRSRGLFAGVSLEGSTLRADDTANQELYGKKVSAGDIVRRSAVPMPAAANDLIATLTKHSPKNLSDPASLRN